MGISASGLWLARHPEPDRRLAGFGIGAVLDQLRSQLAQHSGIANGPSQIPQVVKWLTPVDQDPQYAGGGDLYAHYGSPVITARNTVLVGVKIGAQGGFAVNAFVGGNGHKLWTLGTDYVLPAHDWTPPMGITLTPGDAAVVIPGAGGSVWVRSTPNSIKGATNRMTFVGLPNYLSDPAAFNDAIQICTPITSDGLGNLYFGYLSSGVVLPGYPNGIPSGLARISSTGTGSFVSASQLCNDTNYDKIAYNCAPALTGDGGTLYIAVNQYNFSGGYLCRVTSSTLTPFSRVFLSYPHGGNAVVPDDGTASPTIGPDGDVYYGVLESGFPTVHHDRGWLLHYDSTLATTKIPGSFGWDDSASIVPSKLVPSYTGTSSYLVLTKYNDYSDSGIGGTGANKVAILDPFVSMNDPILPSVKVMNEVIWVLGPTPNIGQPGVREWCINTAAIDQVNKCAIVNSEDGHVYRWDFTTNTLSPGLNLAAATGEAYTPTAIGPDGSVYAINNAVLSCCGASSGSGSSRGEVGLPFIETLRPYVRPIFSVVIPLALLCCASIALTFRAVRSGQIQFRPFGVGRGTLLWIPVDRSH